MLQIGIVGGGIGGLAAALALRARGHQVQVFEGAAAITEVGSGLTLWANATRALRHLGVLGPCLERSQGIRLFQLRRAGGELLMQIPIERFATEPVAMHRGDLQLALLQALPPECIHTNHRCLSVREDQAGVYLGFGHAERGPYDLVVGADGLRSTLRRYVADERAPKYQGYVIWRGVAADAVSEYPAGVISESWGRGHRFGVLPLGLGRVCWYATANQPLGAPTPIAERQARIQRITAGWHPPIGRLVAATNAAAILENPAFDRDIRGSWTRGATVIVGDAAHPLTPNLGQGVCMALEDAVVLGEVFAGVEPGKEAVAAALARYTGLRLPRVKGIARRCRWLGAIGQWQSPIVAPVRNRIAAMVPGAYFTYSSRAIQAYAADQLAPAVNSLRSKLPVTVKPGPNAKDSTY